MVYSIGQGFDKQFPEGQVGYHANAHSAESVADSITKIIENYGVITKNISSKARRYSWDAICNQYCDIYKTVK